MINKRIRVLAALIVVLLFSFSGFAQQELKKKRKSASLDGTTGLFKTWDAESLRQGEMNFSLGFDHFNRDPGELVIKRVPAGVAIGLLDQLELFAEMDALKRVRSLSTQTYRVLPGALPRPATSLGGVNSFTNAAPFMDVPVATDRGDALVGVKLNLISEDRGGPLSMALAATLGIPGHTNITTLNRGLSTGSYQGGFTALLSKTAADVLRAHLNMGVNLVQDPEINGVTLAKLQNEFIYRGGAEFPPYGTFRIITELSGKKYFGDDKTVGLNPKSPIDLILGMRVYPKEWFSLGAGYQASLNHVDRDSPSEAFSTIFPAGTNGFVIQGAFGVRRHIPPTATCSVANPSIKQDEQTALRVGVAAPDAESMTYNWSATGGKITGNNDTATFDATGVAPGKYTVTANVNDGHSSTSCSTDITVIKKNLAPTVACSASTIAVTQGDSVTVRADASDPNNDVLKYVWTVNGQNLAATGPSVTFGSEGRQPGNYNITVTVSDGEFNASCTSAITVRERVRPNQPPTIEALTPTVDVLSGGTVPLQVRASDPDGDPLQYSWSTTGGAIRGSGDNVTFDATGLKAGSYTVTASVDDGRGGRASTTMTVNVSERMVLTRDDKCGYFAAGGARLDNCAKAMLDDIAIRMKNEPQLRANIIGYTDASRAETSKKNLGQNRAKAAADYLVSKGVEVSRLTNTDGGTNNPAGDNSNAAGRKKSRRVEIEFSVR